MFGDEGKLLRQVVNVEDGIKLEFSVNFSFIYIKDVFGNLNVAKVAVVVVGEEMVE